MPRKPKFKPTVTRVKLNPEQAVLSCACYDGGNRLTGANLWTYAIGDPTHACAGKATYDGWPCGAPPADSESQKVEGSATSS